MKSERKNNIPIGTFAILIMNRENELSRLKISNEAKNERKKKCGIL